MEKTKSEKKRQTANYGAMEGMLQALEPRVSLDKGAALSPRLQAMLEKKRLAIMTSAAQGRLEKTLSKAQEARKAQTAAKDQKTDKPQEKGSE